MCLQTNKIIKSKDVVFMVDSGSMKFFRRCVQVGEMKALRRWWWANLPKCLWFMAVNNPWMAASEWEVMRSRWGVTWDTGKLLWVLLRSNDIPFGSGSHSENGAKPTFCLNVVRNGQMRQYIKILWVGMNQSRIICGDLWATLERYYCETKQVKSITNLWLLAKWECWRWSIRLLIVIEM